MVMIDINVAKKVVQHKLQNYILSGGDYMYTYNISEDTTKNVKNMHNQARASDNANQLLNAINDINNRFTLSGAPSVSTQPVNFDRKQAPDKSPEEIARQAETGLAHYRNQNINAIHEDSQNRRDDLIANQETVTQSTREAQDNFARQVEQAKQNASNQALSRGLARSSIVVNQLAAFDRSQLDHFAELDKKLTGQIDAINFEINGLSSELNRALNNFDIAYSVKLQEKINTLSQDLANRQAEVLEYNNQIALREAQFNVDLERLQNDLNSSNWRQATDIVELYARYGQNAVNRVISDSVMNASQTFLRGLTNEEARAVLQDENVRAALGNNHAALLAQFE